jgi:hypothetical protein
MELTVTVRPGHDGAGALRCPSTVALSDAVGGAGLPQRSTPYPDIGVDTHQGEPGTGDEFARSVTTSVCG